MKERCTRKNHPQYARYGGAGIKICESWTIWGKGFANFIKDMGPKPSYERTVSGKRPLYSLDRIDVNGDYEPSNCRWATPRQQCRNRTNNVLLTHNGETHCVMEWAEILGLKPTTIYRRIEYGFSVDRILAKPKLRK